MNRIEFWNVAQRIRYKKDWKLTWRYHDDFNVSMQFEFERPDVVTGEMGTGYTGETLAYLPHHNEESMVRFIFSMARAAEEHECREWFMYGDQKPFDPHIRLVKPLSEIG